MNDSILTLLIVLITMLSILTGVFLGALIIVLVTIHKTLKRAQQAIDTVEDTALRSLSPFLTLKAIFSDTRGFVSAMQAIIKAVRGKKK